MLRNIYAVIATVTLTLTYPAAAAPISYSLSNSNNSFLRLALFADDGFDRFFINLETAPTGGLVTAEVVGTLDPGLNVNSISLSWEQIAFQGVVPNVGDFAIVLDPIEITLTGDPLNTDGRLKPSDGYESWLPTSSMGSPIGNITIAGQSASFDFGALDCNTGCGFGLMNTNDLTDLQVNDFLNETQWNDNPILTVGDVDFYLTVDVLWIADYTVVPEPSTGLLVVLGLTMLCAKPRSA